MSAESSPTSAQCAQCNGHRDPMASVRGSFCSTECYYRSKGAGVLKDLHHDHTVCSTCYRRLKETERPSDDYLRRAGASDLIRETFVGFEYHTPNAERADGAPRPADDSGPGLFARETPTTHTPLGCRCGSLDTHEPDATLADVEGGAVVVNLLRQLWRLYDQGAIDHKPSKERLFDGLREQGKDWEYAVGRCLYG